MISGFTITSHEGAERILRFGDHASYQNLISIGDPDTDKPDGYNKIPHRLRLEFFDCWTQAGAAAGYTPATPSDVALLIDFCGRVRGRTLIHCWMGKRRSAAAAVILAAMQLGPGRESDAVEVVRLSKFDVDPNKWVVRLADHMLGRDGRLFAALLKRFPAPVGDSMIELPAGLGRYKKRA